MHRYSLRDCEERFPEIMEVARRHVHDWRTSGATEPEDVLLRAALHRIVDNSSPAVTFVVIDRLLKPKEQAGAALAERNEPMPETPNHEHSHRLENITDSKQLAELSAAGYLSPDLNAEDAGKVFDRIMTRLRTPRETLRAEKIAARPAGLTPEQKTRLEGHFRRSGGTRFCDCAGERDYLDKLGGK